MENNYCNPWKGLDSYSSADSSFFYGRKEETESLTNAIIDNRITVLYGPSGVGKSSILNAGVIPRLMKHNYLIVYISMRELDTKSNSSIPSQIVASVEAEAKKQKVDIVKLIGNDLPKNAADSMWCYFHSREFWSFKNELLVPLIIIDQFEEIFKESVREQKTSFFFVKLDELSNSVPPLSIREQIDDIETLNSFSQSATFHFVFSLREDYLPRLDDYVYSLGIQELKKSRFSISPFEEKQAIEVITKPIEGLVSKEVAHRIIRILSSHSPSGHTSPKIEPFLLSLYMYRVCDQMIKRNESTISEKLINEVGQDVVNDYYLESMGKVSTKAMKYLEKELLTQKGHRDSISIDRLLSDGKVHEKELETLLSARILKKSTINNVERIEFTHDILSKYAKRNKDKREQGNKSSWVSGALGAFVSIVLAIIVGIIMDPKWTYISIPILITTFVFSSFSIFKSSNSSRKTFYYLISTFIIIGILIDLSQIIPGYGYVLFGLSVIASYFIVNTLRSKHFANAASTSTIFSSILIWLFAITIIPSFCFGYNYFKGMNYARSQSSLGRTFYIKNKNNSLGLRNWNTILVQPQFDSTLISFGNGYIAKREGKYGLLSSNYNDSIEFVYDGFKIEEENLFFYINGKEISNNGIGISWSPLVKESQKPIIREIVNNMVFIKGGIFSMGTELDKVKIRFPSYKPINGEEIVHKVKLTDYYMNRFEVTLNEWKTVMEYDARLAFNVWNNADSIDNPNLPVYKVSYSQCESFVSKLNSLTGLDFSLPTEAQWEYAAKEGQKQSPYFFAGSDNLNEVGWFSENSKHSKGNDTIRLPHAIGELKPNSLGLYDMSGNMQEYCKDRMSLEFYKESNGMEDPYCDTGITKNNKKVYVVRGGSFLTGYKVGCVLTKRYQAFDDRNEAIGFRLALSPNN